MVKRGEQFRLVIARKFHQQQSFRTAFDHVVNRCTERRNRARQIEHIAVHQFHSRRSELDDVLSCFHGRVEAVEMANSLHFMTGNAVQPQFYFGEEAEGAFRADQEFCQVRRLLSHHVKVVAGNVAQHFWNS